MYVFHDDAGHHHGSQYKQITSHKRQDPSQARAFLGTFGNSWTLFGILDIFGIGFGKTLFFWTLG